MSKKHSRKEFVPAPGNASWHTLNNFKARLLIITACIVCYGNTVFNDFAFDDDLAFTQNTYVQKGVAGIPGILTHPYFTTKTKSADYRPLVGITYAIEKQFFGNNAHAGHVINLLFYIICCLTAFGVLNRMLLLNSLPAGVALIIIMFYAVHPSHTEVVSSIKNRDEILSLTFAFLAFGYALKYFTAKESGITHALALMAFLLLSLLSKLTALPIVAVIWLAGLFMVDKSKRKVVYYLTAAMVATVFIYGIVALQHYKRPNYFYENPLPFNQSASLHLGTAFETMFFYFKFMLVPYPFSFYYGYNTLPLLPMSDIKAVFSFFLYTGILVYGIRSFKRKQTVGFFLLAYLLSIGLYLNFPFPYTGIVGERVLFQPGFWFIGAVVILLYRLGGFADLKAKAGSLKNAILVFGVIIFSAYAWLTIQRNFQWKNNLTLMSSDIQHLQNSTLANYFYASQLMETSQKYTGATRDRYLDMATKYYHQSLTVSPGYSQPYFKLGMIYEYDKHRGDSAFIYFKRASTLDTASNEARFQLAKSYSERSDYKSANTLYENVYHKIPTDTLTLFFYAQSLFFAGDTSKAHRINTQLFALNPGNFLPYLNRGMFTKFSGNMPAAIPDLERAYQLGCKDPALLNVLSNYYLETGQTDKARTLQQFVKK